MQATAIITARVRVYHSRYGCDSGCCGHVVEVTRPDGTKCDAFEFDHPDVEFRGGDASAWAIALAKDVIASRWPECVDTIDWSTADVSKAGDC